MASSIVLNDAQIRGLISGAVEQQHTIAATVWVARHGGACRPIQPTDKPTPAAAKYKALETLWSPVLQQVYAMPTAQALKGILVDPRIGTARIAAPPIVKKGGA